MEASERPLRSCYRRDANPHTSSQCKKATSHREGQARWPVVSIPELKYEFGSNLPHTLSHVTCRASVSHSANDTAT